MIDCLMVDAISAIFQSSYNDQRNEEDLMIRLFSCTFFFYFECFVAVRTHQYFGYIHTINSMMCLKLVSE